MLVKGDEGVHHLSPNEEVHHYIAGPVEKMVKHIWDYHMKIDQGSVHAVEGATYERELKGWCSTTRNSVVFGDAT
jgi:hypothetical protein